MTLLNRSLFLVLEHGIKILSIAKKCIVKRLNDIKAQSIDLETLPDGDWLEPYRVSEQLAELNHFIAYRLNHISLLMRFSG